MPIYAYRCAACGHAKDVLQKISDPVLSTCPACGAESFQKQLTAAGFQLKGSGWYVTDFKSGGGAGSDKPADAAAPASAPAAGSSPSSTSSSDAGGAAGGCGASCACH
ncbi:FmdB family zinc ribbon protein [uncultured Piscinibacter sp.]|uniref:FmdB family zinc ribbon protein n=1 Tax=uncultured Piscinibacter sp. TaxID=1131835 RepID=UPI00261E274C|nr:FmdB family zinc ribbon protein [uncultured Piscinibacter sp.]